MKVTIAEIAEKAGVSKMTVSRVLSGKGQVAPETRKKIADIAESLNYQPNLMARSLASKYSMIIGVIIPKIEHLLLDNYMAQILTGVTDIALQNDYRILLCPVEPGSGDGSDYVNIARSKLVDGLILLKTKIRDPNIDVLADSGFPFILINHKRYGKNVNFVDSQNLQGARLAVKYLYDKGHRDIAFISGNTDESNGRDRLNGFKDAMKEYGLVIRKDWILEGNFNKETARHISMSLFNNKKYPSAIFCADDYMAIGVMETAQELGLKIPEQTAIVGFDDIEPASYVHPALTTIRQPVYELGKTAARILLNIIKKEQKLPVHKLLNVELIERESA